MTTVPAPDSLLAPLAAVSGPDVDVALRLAASLTGVAPLPGSGRTAERWRLLGDLARRDLTTARIVEAHLDATAILAEAGDPGRRILGAAGADSTWGVFAAEGPGVRLEAYGHGDGWVLEGVKPWCSLANRLSHALVTAQLPGPGERCLFAVSLKEDGVSADPGTWHARGLVDVPSGPVRFTAVPAVPVGAPGWYLTRPGFAHGGMGVAACWYGGATGVAQALWDGARRRPPDQVARWHLGEADLVLGGARRALAEAAAAVDAGEAQAAAGELLALRVRSTVAGAVEEILRRVGHALGPAPLSLDDAYARRVADLTLYVRQHHAERDVARLGELLLVGPEPPW